MANGDRSDKLAQMMGNMQYGWRAAGGDPMGAMMGFMGMPFQNKQGGQWMTVNPATHSTYQTGTTNPVQARPSKPNGNDPNLTDEEKKRAELIKAGMTPWYVDWLQTSGNFGGVPPKTPGLLG